MDSISAIGLVFLAAIVWTGITAVLLWGGDHQKQRLQGLTEGAKAGMRATP